MKRSVIAGGLVVAVGLCGLMSAVSAGEEENKSKVAPPPCKEAAAPGYEQMMQMWAAMNQPGPEHAHFKESVGKWKTESKMWMGPGEPTLSYGISEVSLVFGGRYLQEHHRCTSEETPFEGIALLGYDTMKKKYVCIWYDSMSTGIMFTEGTRDEATKTTTMFSAEYDDPFKGRGKVKNVVRELSEDAHVMEMYWIGADGRERKEMEMTYQRV